MIPTQHPSDSTPSNSSTADRDRPPEQSAVGATRRAVVRSIVSGAALLGGSSALSGAAGGQSSEPEPLPAEVSDYELVVGDDATDTGDGSLSPSHAESFEPTVTFDGDDVIVEGAMTYGSSSCDEIALTALRRAYDVEGHVDVRLDARRRPTVMPGDDCTADLAAERYRLVLTGSGEPPIERCSVTENPTDAYHSLTVEASDEDLELPDGVRDYRLSIDRSAATGESDSDPRPRFAPAEDGIVVQVNGTMEIGSSSCRTLAVSDLHWTDDRTHLVARVDSAARERDVEDCTTDDVTAEYQLVLFLDESPHAVTAREGDARADDPERSATVEREDLPPLLPDGVLDLEFSTESRASHEAIAADPSVSTAESADGPVVTVEGAILVSPCHTASVVDVRWTDDGHLVVVTDAVGTYGSRVTFDGCPLEALPTRTSYTVDLDVESLPDVVTAEERNAYSDHPTRTTTATFGGDADCDDAAIDGRTVCDVNGDGHYRDVTGDGTVGQTDVVEFFQHQHREAWQQPVLFDFSGNAEVGHGDVVALFEDVATGAV